MPNKDKDLEPVSDLKTVHRYLRYGIEFHEQVSCYIESADLSFTAELRAADKDSFLIELDIEAESFAQLNYVSLGVIDQPQTAVRLSYSVNEATFFVQARVQERKVRKLTVKAELPMYKLQRRESMRIKVLESHQASIQLGKEVHPVFDIGAGGLSIVVGAAQASQFPKQQIFPAQLKFIGNEIKVNLEVKNVLKFGKDDLKIKIGFRFRGLPAAFEQLIVREAYLHTHKIWSRWL